MPSQNKMVTISLSEYKTLKQNTKLLQCSQLYKRLLEFEENMAKGKRFTRKDLGF